MSIGSSSDRPLLPAGYRFAPTDEELMIFYLRNKVSFNPLPAGAITEIDADELYSKPPPAIVDNPRGETREWYFYIRNNKHEDEDEVTSTVRKNVRMVGNGQGFWRSVGRDDLVYAGEMVCALKIHYIYYEGSMRKHKKTHWRMEEYHLARGGGDQQDLNNEEWVLGRITRGRGYCSDYY